MIVCNSTVLIYLSKLNKLHLLRELFKLVLIPEEVKREVVDEGRKRDYVDAVKVGQAIKDNWLKIQSVEIEGILGNINIHKGEAEAISLAYQKKLNLLLDQVHAREAAKMLGINSRGTIYVLFLALKKGKIDYDSYLSSLLDLVNCGFRMSQEVYLEAIKMGKEFKKKEG